MRFSRFLLPIVVSVFAVVPSARAFTDVTTGDPHAEAIYYLYNNGMIQGYADGSFRPDATVNRVEFLKIVYLATTGQNAKEFEEARVCRHRVPYTDVPMTDWYHVYLCAADSQGIIDGYPDGTFRPQANVNFAEGAKIIAESFNREKKHLALPLAESPWYKKYALFLDREHAIPLEIGRLDQPLTRGQMAEIMYRLATGTAGPSRTYGQLVGEPPLDEEYNRPVTHSFSVDVRTPLITLYFFPWTGEAAFVSHDNETMMTFDADFTSDVLREHRLDLAYGRADLGQFATMADIEGDGTLEFLLQETEDPDAYTVWKYEINEFTGKPWMFPSRYDYRP